MKKFLVVVLIVSSTISQGFCQSIYRIDFDSNQDLDKLFIDTISNPNNCWQIGKPSKASLLAAYSSLNVIATDTLNSYPANDTSSFIITHIATYGSFMHADLEGYYYIKSDTLSDYGKLEISLDIGKTWIDHINDTTYKNCWRWESKKPTLTGSSSKWEFFYVSFAVGSHFNLHEGDTVLFRFTFISDSIDNNNGGLMFDNLIFVDPWEAIEVPPFYLQIFPNPATDALFISSEHNLIGEVEVFNPMGEKVLHQSIPSSSAKIDISALKTGVYFVIFKNNFGSFQQKFMKL